jgi:endonuclease YncB( thermonuclease family)
VIRTHWPTRWAHRAHVTRVKDGDTVEADIDTDVGFAANGEVAPKEALRALDVDAWEVKDILGPAAVDATRWWIAAHPDVWWHTWRRDSFGRRLGYLVDAHTGEDWSTYLAETAQVVKAHLTWIAARDAV